MNISQRFIPVSYTKTRPRIKMIPRYITIHETDNTSVGADAAAHAALQQRGNERTASWHLQVDDHEIIQSIPYDEVAWAAGDGRKGPGNSTSIHIEMCVNADGDYEQTVSNTIELVLYLMNRFKIPIDHVVPHQYWSGKNCPRNLLPRWDNFMKRIQSSKDGWVKLNSQWFFYKNGLKQTGWLKDNGKWYFLKSNGVMQNGWVKVANKWYFLNFSGVMQTGWLKDDNKWYYLDSSGAMQTGWLKLSSKWYFLNAAGVMQTGWAHVENKWYFLNSNGVMVTGNHTIDGKAYTFGDDGALTGEQNQPSSGILT